MIEVERVVSIERPGAKAAAAKNDDPLAVRDILRTGLKSRATVRLNEREQLRVGQTTDLQLLGLQVPGGQGEPREISIRRGVVYIFSREPEQRVNIKTLAGNGALRGTQLIVEVRGNRALFALLEGEMDLSNSKGKLTLKPGEFGEMRPGQAPRKTAVLEAKNILQWALYYPAVLDPTQLGLTPGEESKIAGSLEAYRAGDLLGALEKYPLGRSGGPSAARVYRAGILLAVGRVDDARAELRGVSSAAPGRRAIEQLIAAVNFEDFPEGEPSDAAGWVAQSYYEQSKSKLDAALAAAKKAAELSPDNGYAWTRVAEMEFSFGHTPQALDALKRALELTPRNAQAHAANGFALSAQNRIKEARAAFDEAIALDGALGNAWLGRGLVTIRHGDLAAGLLDLQTAATLEPQRAIFHSYLGKGYSQSDDSSSATKDLDWAKTLDPNDPTPWLYSAIQKKQENRYNESIADLEQSLALNENRRVYRSKLLLDQDRSVRSTNLASIYQNNGMTDVSVREAAKAVTSDYSNASSHLFLSNSYEVLRDPRRVQLRYETAWFNELLLSNLLSPVGGGSLSQYVSQQEYSKLFESEGLGISSVTEYFSNGDFRETGSQYGTVGNLSYALDAEYLYQNGIRPNNEISRFEAYATFKLQITPQDTIFLKTKYEDLQNGDIFQRFDQREVNRTNRLANTFDFRELQEPALILAGLHHEWSPGNHTLVLAQRLANDQVLTAEGGGFDILQRDITGEIPPGFDASGIDPNRPLANRSLLDLLNGLRGRGILEQYFPAGIALDVDYRANFEIYGGEVQQIFTIGPHTLVGGGRFQSGTFETQSLLQNLPPNLAGSESLFLDPPARQNFSVDFERINLYFYETWKVAPWLSLTGGVTYDKLTYPENFRSIPISNQDQTLEQTSPKAGFIFQPHRSVTLRGAYTRGISGVSFDESVRLEPTQVAGFNQAFRTLIPEDLTGAVGGSSFETYHLSLEQKLPTRTYWGVQYEVLQQDLDRTVGAFDFLSDTNDPGRIRGILPSSLRQQLDYREDSLTATVNQLIGNSFAVGIRYRVSDVKLRQTTREVVPSPVRGAAGDSDTTRSSILHELGITAVYNLPSGFFARGEALWFNQENDGFAVNPLQPSRDPRPGDSFWQLNATAGWRFRRNTCELSAGVLNITGSDYQLEPLTSYNELPRDRTFFVRCKLTF